MPRGRVAAGEERQANEVGRMDEGGRDGTAIVRGKKSVETMRQGEREKEKQGEGEREREIQHRRLGEGIYICFRGNKCFA